MVGGKAANRTFGVTQSAGEKKSTTGRSVEKEHSGKKKESTEDGGKEWVPRGR